VVATVQRTATSGDATYLGQLFQRRHEKVVAHHSQAQEAEENDEEEGNRMAGATFIPCALCVTRQTTCLGCARVDLIRATATEVDHGRHDNAEVGHHEAHGPQQFAASTLAGRSAAHGCSQQTRHALS